MRCPKCNTKIGVMKHEVMVDSGFVQFTRCVICGYWSQPYPPCKRHNKVRLDDAVM